MNKWGWLLIYCVLALFIWVVVGLFEIELEEKEIELRLNEPSDYLPRAYYIN